MYLLVHYIVSFSNNHIEGDQGLLLSLLLLKGASDLLTEVLLDLAGLTQDTVGGLVLHLGGDLLLLGLQDLGDDRKHALARGSGGSGLDLRAGGVALLRLGTLRHKHLLTEELVETRDVQVEGLLAVVVTTVVNGNADGLSLHGRDSSLLQLLEGETTSSLQLEVVAHGLRVHSRAEETV